MATIVVTNLSSTASVYCADLYVSIPASGSVTTTRSVSDLPRMTSLQSLLAAGSVGVAITYSAAEQASGLVNEGETAPSMAAAFGGQSQQVLRVPITAGGGGSADDVSIFAVGELPYAKMRVLDAFLLCSAGNSGGRHIGLYTAASAGGTLLADVSATAAGRNSQTTTVTATSQAVNGATVGLFAHRSDSAIAGELVITFEWEA